MLIYLGLFFSLRCIFNLVMQSKHTRWTACKFSGFCLPYRGTDFFTAHLVWQHKSRATTLINICQNTETQSKGFILSFLCCATMYGSTKLNSVIFEMVAKQYCSNIYFTCWLQMKGRVCFSTLMRAEDALLVAVSIGLCSWRTYVKKPWKCLSGKWWGGASLELDGQTQIL